MLTTLHKLSGTWFFKGILLLTALSFMTFFGVGGLDEMKNRNDAVVTVGDDVVTAAQFVDEYNRQLGFMQTSLGSQFPEYEKEVEKQIRDSLTNKYKEDLLLKSIASDMGFIISDDMLRIAIYAIPDFQDESGSFNPMMFSSYLSSIKLSEEEYIERYRDEVLRRQVMTPFAQLSYVPEALAKSAYSTMYEKRDLQVADIPYKDVKVDEKPTSEEIEAYYDSDKETFYMNPEYRALTLVYLPFADMFAKVPVSEEEIVEAYNQGKDIYVKSELRDVDQMRFDSEEKAMAAYDALQKKDADFRAVARDMAGQDDLDTYLGKVAKNGVLVEVADDLFKTPKGGVTAPIASEFGWHVFKVLDIESEVVTPLADVKDEIKDNLQRQKVTDSLYEKAYEIDDFLGSGKTLEEAKETFALSMMNIPDIDISGKNRAGKVVDIPFKSAELFPVAFSLPTGSESQVLEAEEGFFVIRVDDITPPQPKPLEEVKDKVIATWQADKQKEYAIKKAEELLAELAKDGANPKGVKSFKAVSRDTKEDALKEQVRNKAFNFTLGEADIVSYPDGVAVVKVLSITPANADDDITALEEVRLGEMQNTATILSYGVLADYATKYKSKVDEVVLNRVFNIEDSESDALF